MSEQAGPEEEVIINFEANGDAAFASLMDALAPAEDKPEAPEGEPEAVVDAGAGGTPSAAPQQPAQQTGEAGAGAPGAAGDQGVLGGGQGAAPGTPDLGVGAGAPGVGTVTYESIAPKFGEMFVKLEENALKLRQTEALEEVREEFSGYFEAISQHPRALIGKEVPSFTEGRGMEKLLDSQDARDWQEAAKQELAKEIRYRAEQAADADSDHLTMIHQSIELFQKNPDLIPGTTKFDKELADSVARFAKPYEVRDNGKLLGYSIPIQALVEQEREVLAHARAEKAAAAAAAPPPAAPKAAGKAKAPAPAEAPQAGIQSRAGQSTEKEDFSALFGTLGLGELRF